MRACAWAEFHAPGGVDFAPNMVTKHFALAWPKYGHRALRSGFAPNKGMCHFPPNGRRADKSRGGPSQEGGAVTRHPPNGSRRRGSGPRPKNDGKRIEDCVPSARARFCLGLRLTASRAFEASRLAHYDKRSTISSREITSSRLLWVQLPWSVLWRLVLWGGAVIQPREHGQVASHVLFPQLVFPPELKGQ